ncbi:MAG: hypothetical protein RL217_1837 [Pseudomonadota bacterium]|jgi:sigma-E factor negative regulatory protein RseC
MNQEWVRVSAVQYDGIWVESQRHSACDSCNARSGCGQRSLAKLGKTVSLWLPLPDTRTYQVGQSLELELPVGGLALSALMLYGLPLVVLILAVLLAQGLASDWQVALAGVVGLALGLLLGRFFSLRYRHLWQPKIRSSCYEEEIKQVSL